MPATQQEFHIEKNTYTVVGIDEAYKLVRHLKVRRIDGIPMPILTIVADLINDELIGVRIYDIEEAELNAGLPNNAFGVSVPANAVVRDYRAGASRNIRRFVTTEHVDDIIEFLNIASRK